MLARNKVYAVNNIIDGEKEEDDISEHLEKNLFSRKDKFINVIIFIT